MSGDDWVKVRIRQSTLEALDQASPKGRSVAEPDGPGWVKISLRAATLARLIGLRFPGEDIDALIARAVAVFSRKVH